VWTAADRYWLGFESHRRNQAWVGSGTFRPAATISASNENAGSMFLPFNASIRHDRLNLKASQSYVLRGLASSSLGGTLRVTSGTRSATLQTTDVTLASAIGWQPFSLVITGQGAEHRLALQARGQSITLANLTLARPAAVNDFATFDARLPWRTADGRNAVFIPVGKSENSDNIDFSMGVLPGVSVGSSSEAFTAATFNRVCFDANVDPRLAQPSAGVVPRGTVRLRDRRGDLVTTSFALDGASGRLCSDAAFGLDPITAEVWFDAPNAPYLVDNVEAISASFGGNFLPALPRR
jgi:hypothetical protein